MVWEVIEWFVDQKDLKQIGDLIDAKLDTKLAAYNEGIENKIFMWKSEIIDIVDALAKEIRDEREFREIASSQITGNTRRVEKLETKVFGVVQNVT